MTPELYTALNKILSAYIQVDRDDVTYDELCENVLCSGICTKLYLYSGDKLLHEFQNEYKKHFIHHYIGNGNDNGFLCVPPFYLERMGEFSQVRELAIQPRIKFLIDILSKEQFNP